MVWQIQYLVLTGSQKEFAPYKLFCGDGPYLVHNAVGVTLDIEAGYVVVNAVGGDVLEGHGGREVFVVGKSGSKSMFWKLLMASKAICSAACD